MNTLAKKEFIKCGFEVVVQLIDFECGLSEFNSKWLRNSDGLVIGDKGDRWDCTHFTIGKLKDGCDATVNSAQKEFNRDCFAFDVGLTITVYKHGVELCDENIVGGDYNWNDKTTPEELLEELYREYGEQAEPQIKKAGETIKLLID